jgi:serine/threonine protein kinase
MSNPEWSIFSSRSGVRYLGTWFVLSFLLRQEKQRYFVTGVLLFEMLFGYRPFEHVQDNYDKMSYIARLTQNPTIPTTTNPHSRDVLQQCLQINPACRPNADQLLQHSFFSNS